jgi:hypothetical protein
MNEDDALEQAKLVQSSLVHMMRYDDDKGSNLPIQYH